MIYVSASSGRKLRWSSSVGNDNSTLILIFNLKINNATSETEPGLVGYSYNVIYIAKCYVRVRLVTTHKHIITLGIDQLKNQWSETTRSRCREVSFTGSDHSVTYTFHTDPGASTICADKYCTQCVYCLPVLPYHCTCCRVISSFSE